MGTTPRNSIKGYSYQQSVFIYFLALMDTERKISKITVEATDTKHFDDIYLENVLCEDSGLKSYRIQVKNYPGTTLSDISIKDNCVTIKTTIKAHVAQQEKEKIRDRVMQGLNTAKKKGKKLGRPATGVPKEFIKEYERFQSGQYGRISVVQFAKMNGIAVSTFYKYASILKEKNAS